MCVNAQKELRTAGTVCAGVRSVPPSWNECLSTQARSARFGPFFGAFKNPAPYVLERTECGLEREHNAAMKPKFTDEHKFPRGYDFSGATDITKTFAAARLRFALAKEQPEGNVRMLQQVIAARA
jgi:hypothetical protein